MQIEHIPGARNPADALTRKAWFGKKKEMSGVKQEEDLWMQQWRSRVSDTDEKLQGTVEKMFGQQKEAEGANQDQDYHNFFNSCILNGDEGIQEAKLCVTRTRVYVDQALKTQIVSAVQNDIAYEEVLKKLEEDQEEEVPTERGKFRIKDGMLVFHPRSSTIQEGAYWKIVIPDDIEVKKAILSELHSVPYAGHPGVAKTLQHTAQFFYWKGMSVDVRDFVLQCEACQVEKADHRKYAGDVVLPAGKESAGRTRAPSGTRTHNLPDIFGRRNTKRCPRVRSLGAYSRRRSLIYPSGRVPHHPSRIHRVCARDRTC